MADDTVELELSAAQEAYSGKLRRVVFRDAEMDKDCIFIENNFRLAATTIAAICKKRWQSELFFKWMTQNLRVKTLLGSSENAVTIQSRDALAHFREVPFGAMEPDKSGQFWTKHDNFG